MTRNQLRTKGLITGMSEILVSPAIKTLNYMHYHFSSNFCVKNINNSNVFIHMGKGVEVFLPVSASLGLKIIEKSTPEELPRKNEFTLGPDI